MPTAEDRSTSAATAHATQGRVPLAAGLLIAMAVLCTGAAIICAAEAAPDGYGEEVWDWRLLYMAGAQVVAAVIFGASATALRLLQQIADAVNRPS